MDLELSLNETRVIGCLLEKESTTPDQYPLSLNALTLGEVAPLARLATSNHRDGPPGIAGQRPDLPHGEGASHPPRGPGTALALKKWVRASAIGYLLSFSDLRFA